MPSLVEALDSGLLDGPTTHKLTIFQSFRILWWGFWETQEWEVMMRYREKGMTVIAAYGKARMC